MEREYYKEIIRDAFAFLQENKMGGDALKCYILSYNMLCEKGIDNVIDLELAKELIRQRIEEEICKDTTKYGVEYVSLPSDFFTDGNTKFLNDEIRKLITEEKKILQDLQKEDGGFDISWQWYTDYPEFQEVRRRWRARITIDKMLFEKNY